jgi:hypothetical protein
VLGVEASQQQGISIAHESFPTVVLCRPLILVSEGRLLSTPWTRRLLNLRMGRPYINGSATTLHISFIPSDLVTCEEGDGRWRNPSREYSGEA